MRAPDGLGAAGKRGWERAVAQIETTDDPDRLCDLAARYANQVDIADRARRKWRREKCPLTVRNPNGAHGTHPLVKVMQDAEKLAQRFGEALGIAVPAKPKHRGPAIAAVRGDGKATGTITEAPSARLRAVK